MLRCKYCKTLDDISKTKNVCSYCINICINDEARGLYIMDSETWEKHKNQINVRITNAQKKMNSNFDF